MNQNDLWLERWQRREIGFNQEVVNPFMVAYFSQLGLSRGSRVFVPLCGKSIDISWLLAQGYLVVGVELSEQAVIELFDTLGIKPKVSKVGTLISYSAKGITIFVGDIFMLTPEILAKVEAIYDRAALVALPMVLRAQYTRHLKEITNNAPQLLLSMEYDQSLMDRSPYAVDEEEIQRHYAMEYTIECLCREEIVGGFKGKLMAFDVVWLLTK